MKYEKAFEIASLVLQDRHRHGEQYRPDVIRIAALAAIDVRTAAIDAMEKAFQASRISINPRWDGSVA